MVWQNRFKWPLLNHLGSNRESVSIFWLNISSAISFGEVNNFYWVCLLMTTQRPLISLLSESKACCLDVAKDHLIIAKGASCSTKRLETVLYSLAVHLLPPSMDVVRTACDTYPPTVVWLQDCSQENQHFTFVSWAGSLRQGPFVHMCLKGAVFPCSFHSRVHNIVCAFLKCSSSWNLVTYLVFHSIN